MSAPDLVALARRAVACKAWRWMPGMRIAVRYSERKHYHMRIVRITTSAVVAVPDDDGHTVFHLDADSFDRVTHPDLSDPATLGCLLALVREAWDHMAHTEPTAINAWRVVAESSETRYVGYAYLPVSDGACADSPEAKAASRYAEAEALVAALESAP